MGKLIDAVSHRWERWYTGLSDAEKQELRDLRELNDREVKAEFKLRLVVIAVLLGISAIATYCPQVQL